MSASNEAVDAIFAKYDGTDVEIQSLGEPDRSIILSISAQNMIDGGGFIVFFEEDIEEELDYHLFVEAYRRIGMNELADNFAEILGFFPDGVPQRDLAERGQYLARFFDDESPEYINILGALENKFFESNERVYQSAGDYISNS